MSDLSPKLREILSARHPGREPEVENETEWMFFYKIGSKSGYKISKFLDESFEIKSAALRQRWPTMKEDERLEFCSCWQYRREWNENDTEILEILMRDGNDRLWKICPFAFTQHPDRDRAVTFLVERLQNYDGDYEPLNYFQALGIMKDQRAAAAIRPYYERYREAMKAESVVGVPGDIYRGPIPYFPYLCACGALVKVDGAPEYEQAIRKYFDHPNEQVRWWAEYALEIEGPTTAKRKAEDKRKLTQE